MIGLRSPGVLTRRRLAAAGLLLGGFLSGIVFQRFEVVGTLLGGAMTGQAAAGRQGAVENPPVDLRGTLSLFILAGQSNMSGRGDLHAEPAHQRVFMFANDYRWKIAKEPVDSAEDQVDLVSQDSGDDAAGFGPGLSFGRALADDASSPAIGLIPCAKGDSTIAEWQPSHSDSTLYGSCLKRVRAASLQGTLSAFLFFQGEADAIDPTRHPGRDIASEHWRDRFMTLVQAMRDDMGVPRLPIVFARIGTHTSPDYFPQWDVVRAQQGTVDGPCIAMIDTDDLMLKDPVHFTTASYRTIGQRFADAYRRLVASSSCR